MTAHMRAKELKTAYSGTLRRKMVQSAVVPKGARSTKACELKGSVPNENPNLDTTMFMYSSLEALSTPEYPALQATTSSLASQNNSDADPLSFVVDLNQLGLRDAYRANEIHRGSQCLIFARVGPEYVNPWSGDREQANWIL